MLCATAPDLKGAKYSCLEAKSMCMMIGIRKTKNEIQPSLENHYRSILKA